MSGADAPGAAGALRDLLERYDRDNRLAIDTVYAQFSPTLDDFYHEALTVVFPEPAGAGVPAAEVSPEITLTRTVPGQEPKSVRGAGAPFPLARAAALAAAALGRDGLRLRPRQVGAASGWPCSSSRRGPTSSPCCPEPFSCAVPLRRSPAPFPCAAPGRGPPAARARWHGPC